MSHVTMLFPCRGHRPVIGGWLFQRIGWHSFLFSGADQRRAPLLPPGCSCWLHQARISRATRALLADYRLVWPA